MSQNSTSQLANPATSISSSFSSTQTASPPNLSSLLLSHRPLGKKVVIVGTGKLALSRVKACLEAGAKCVVLAVEPACIDSNLASSSSAEASTSKLPDQATQIRCLDQELEKKCRDGQGNGEIEWFSAADWNLLCKDSDDRDSSSSLTSAWSNFLDALDGKSGQQKVGNDFEPQLFAVCVTDTLHLAISEDSISDSTSAPNTTNQALIRSHLLSRLCKSKRIPINVADRPNLCDFSFPATHRFQTIKTSTSPSLPSSLQIAVTTNGKGCRLASRIRREIISNLPRNVGDAVEKVGEMREMAKIGDKRRRLSIASSTHGNQNNDIKHRSLAKRSAGRNLGSDEMIEDDLNFDTTPLNSPVPQLSRDVGDQLNKAGQILKEQKKLSNLKQEMKSPQTEGGKEDETIQGEEDEEDAEDTKRRMRWVAQISEYWPIEYLGSLTKDQMKDALGTYKSDDKIKSLEDSSAKKSLPNGNEGNSPVTSTSPSPTRGRTSPSRDQSLTEPTSSVRARRASSQHALDIGPPSISNSSKGNIYLLGAGTGHPGLLTVLAHRILTSSSTDLILSDKLVPASILRLIPSTTPLVIAKKFPGNAEGAQSELIALALKASKEGKNVVRLKQGDPFVYGRGGEEVLAFRNAGIEPTVVPGISSSIAAPLMLGIPVTQRGCSDSLLLCTGVGRGGKIVKLPGYERNRTSILLMGVARLEAVVKALTESESEASTRNRSGKAFPSYTPIAIIERASSTDQRLIASTLEGIVSAMDSSGEQRPPGMIVIGWSVLALEGKGGMDVLDDEQKCLQEARDESKEGEEDESSVLKSAESKLQEKDRRRIQDWLEENGNDKGYILREGLDHVYSQSLNSFASFQQNDQSSGEAHPPSTSKTETESNPGLQNGKDQETLSGTSTPKTSITPTFDLNSRSETGWAESRYSSAPTGGWIEGEGQNIPALNQLEYQQHLEYVRAAEVANKIGKKESEP